MNSNRAVLEATIKRHDVTPIASIVLTAFGRNLQFEVSMCNPIKPN